MRFFRKAKKNEGTLVLAFLADGVAAASIRRPPASKPALVLSAFFACPSPVAPEALEKIGKELGANAYRCATILCGGEYQMLAVDAPNVPAGELKTAIRWRLKDMLDFSVEEATIDVLQMPGDKNASVATHNVFAVAARNSVIEPRQNLFAQAKIGLAVIDVPEMAQRNISALLEPEGRGLAMLSFNADGGLLTVTFNGELYLSRRIDVSIQQLREPDFDKKHASLDKVTLELQRSLDHFDRQFHFINVSKLVLAPNGAAGLDEYLSSNMYMPVETLDLADVIDLSAAPDLADAQQQQRLFLTLGAALRLEGAAQ